MNQFTGNNPEHDAGVGVDPQYFISQSFFSSNHSPENQVNEMDFSQIDEDIFLDNVSLSEQEIQELFEVDIFSMGF